ncbi:SMI1/KNR4 family protein [Kitasatospora sp. NPDC001603]|uniref:SMI1/KNR4 family protein n=1 Tax=Kitasatospora sp. NPDC001603 TaxID=3154388 RepID=UPI003316B3E4
MRDQLSMQLKGTQVDGSGDVRAAWARFTAWLERDDPGVVAVLGGPGDSEAIGRAEVRMGLALPPELRQWLLAHDLDTGWRGEPRETLVERGCDVPVPGGHLLLGLADIERVYLHRLAVERMEPSDDPDCPSWRPEWVPITAERDGLYGTFLDTASGTVGRWAEYDLPDEGVYASLSAFFQQAADELEGITTGDWRGPGAPVRA